MSHSKLTVTINVAALLLCFSESKAQDSLFSGRFFPHNTQNIVLSLNGNAAGPLGEGVQTKFVFNPNINVNYCLSDDFSIGLDGSYISAKPTFNIDDYSAPFANKGFATITKDKSTFSSTTVLLTGGYTLFLKTKEKGSRTKPYKSAEDLTVRLGAGASFNSFPNQTITQDFNGTTDVIAKYSGVGGKVQGVMKAALQFNYWITSNFGFNLNTQYQIQVGAKDFTYSYKDLSNINFNASPPTPIDVLKFQIKNAPTINETTKGITGAFSFGGGIVFALKTRTKSNNTNERHISNNPSILINEQSQTTKQRSKTTEAKVVLGAIGRMKGFNIGAYPLEYDTLIPGSVYHAINEQGLPGGGGGPKKGSGRPIKVIKIDSKDDDRTTNPNGQDDGNPFPPKNPNKKEASKNTSKKSPQYEYVGHVTLIRREINPNLTQSDSGNYIEPLQALPAQNELLTIYSISSLEISSENKFKEKELPVAYLFYKMDGKTIAVPYLIFDLPEEPSEINLRKKKFHYKQLPVEIVTMSDMPEIRKRGEKPQFIYKTLIDNKLTIISMALTPNQTIFPSNNSRNIWCGVSTNCGAVFAVQVPAGTNCGSVNEFFNKVCDGLKSLE